jgi:hypothetical protein
MTQSLTEENRQQIARRSALKRLVDVEDVANAVDFLLGDRIEKHYRHSDYRRRGEHGMMTIENKDAIPAGVSPRRHGCARWN